jgi:C4-dicarboxylate-specific signal transduction histidine kinase
MYVSPLIDPQGQQTGWMTSMTNITEAKRIRDQLSASHERFTTVLEGWTPRCRCCRCSRRAAVRQPLVPPVVRRRSAGHALLAGDEPACRSCRARRSVDSLRRPADAGAHRGRLRPARGLRRPLQKWFDVRARYLQWTDGRLAQMLIATDITARRAPRTQAAQQAEKAQVTSRLVTMGEMASSVAHELNQPLTAITNYCNGMVSRVKATPSSKAT